MTHLDRYLITEDVELEDRGATTCELLVAGPDALAKIQSMASGDVPETAYEHASILLKDVELFDVYEGQQIPSGKKSLAYHLTFQSPGKTLTDKDVSKQRARIIKQLGQRLGARLRD